MTGGIPMPRVLSLLKLLFLIALLGGAVYFFRFTERGRSVTSESLLAVIRDFGPLAPLIYIGVYIVGTVVLLPGTVMSFTGAVLFGAYWGTLYTWIGAVIGSTLAYLVAKQLGRDFIDQTLGGRFDRLERRIRENGFMGLLVIRLIPFFPYNGVNFGCGLTSIRFSDYVLATAIGILPGTFVYQFLFANFGQRILNDGLRLEYLADPQLLLAVALFALFTMIGKALSSRLNPQE
ncbi:MAG: TVP38/TMEM64 family protein [Planctomycetota bacterium]